jgi:hypothetical protein
MDQLRKVVRPYIIKSMKYKIAWPRRDLIERSESSQEG